MTLRDLLEGLADAPPVAVTGIAYDSRRVAPGDCFVAVPGEKDDGSRHVADALRRGALSVVCEHPVPAGVPCAIVPDARRALSRIAARFNGHPARAMEVVGVTGTKGKTTTAYFLEAVLAAAGRVPGVLGTIRYRWPGHEEEAARTTPESADLQRLLARMRDTGCRSAVMEVSSHALVLRRVADVAFRAAVFTNLSRDHLDYHGTPEAYRDAKGLLFQGLAPDAWAVLNADDPASARYRAATRGRVLTYGMEGDADIRAEVLEAGWDATLARFRLPDGFVKARLKLIGRHNVMNALAAAAAAHALGIAPEAIAGGLEALDHVPGRLQRVPCRLPFRVFVDYAHTEDSLRSLLATVRAFTKGRLLLAFGCGGDRDRGKRPRMGLAAQELADIVIATSDNPRSEAPLAILDGIRAGMTLAKPYRVEPDRAAAIRLLMSEAREGDTVLIAGKGHERGQVFKDRTLPFDDVEECLAAVRKLGG